MSTQDSAGSLSKKLIADNQTSCNPRKSVPVRIRNSGENQIQVVSGIAWDGKSLVDQFGRVHSDIRVSITDRCNYRCIYCMPLEGMEFLPRKDLLTYEEIVLVLGAVQSLGVKSVRISGGEPLLRRDVTDLVKLISALGFEDISMTTNGHYLGEFAKALHSNGLKRVNVSVDSLDPGKFSRIRRLGDLSRVLGSISRASEVGLGPIKVNVVVMRGVNEDEIVDFCEYARKSGNVVRFIEFMPLDAQGAWTRDQVVGADEILATIRGKWGLSPIEDDGDVSSPATTYRFDDGVGEIGIIASVTKPFCGDCNRLRLTCEGSIRNCLFAREELSVRDIVRSAKTKEEKTKQVQEAFFNALVMKKAGHGIGDPNFERPNRSMSMIGG